jgi:hypothetical protein
MDKMYIRRDQTWVIRKKIANILYLAILAHNQEDLMGIRVKK